MPVAPQTRGSRGRATPLSLTQIIARSLLQREIPAIVECHQSSFLSGYFCRANIFCVYFGCPRSPLARRSYSSVGRAADLLSVGRQGQRRYDDSGLLTPAPGPKQRLGQHRRIDLPRHGTVAVCAKHRQQSSPNVHRWRQADARARSHHRCR
jgi:hypothetical protein